MPGPGHEEERAGVCKGRWDAKSAISNFGTFFFFFRWWVVCEERRGKAASVIKRETKSPLRLEWKWTGRFESEAAQALGMRALGVCLDSRSRGHVGTGGGERREVRLQESESNHELGLSF